MRKFQSGNKNGAEEVLRLVASLLAQDLKVAEC